MIAAGADMRLRRSTLAGQATDLDPPDLRPLLKGVPGELIRIAGFKLLVQRAWRVIADNMEGRSGNKRVDHSEYGRVTLLRRDGPHIDHRL